MSNRYVTIPGFGFIDIDAVSLVSEYNCEAGGFGVTISGDGYFYHGEETYKAIILAIRCYHNLIPLYSKPKPKLQPITLMKGGVIKCIKINGEEVALQQVIDNDYGYSVEIETECGHVIELTPSMAWGDPAIDIEVTKP